MARKRIPPEHLEEAGYQGKPVKLPESLKEPQLRPVSAKPAAAKKKPPKV